MTVKVGDKVKIVSGSDYLGRTGVIEYCPTCCRALRIQFDKIGNNVKLKNYRRHLIKVDPADEEPVNNSKIN